MDRQSTPAYAPRRSGWTPRRPREDGRRHRENRRRRDIFIHAAAGGRSGLDRGLCSPYPRRASSHVHVLGRVQAEVSSDLLPQLCQTPRVRLALPGTGASIRQQPQLLQTRQQLRDLTLVRNIGVFTDRAITGPGMCAHATTNPVDHQQQSLPPPTPRHHQEQPASNHHDSRTGHRTYAATPAPAQLYAQPSRAYNQLIHNLHSRTQQPRTLHLRHPYPRRGLDTRGRTERGRPERGRSVIKLRLQARGRHARSRLAGRSLPRKQASGLALHNADGDQHHACGRPFPPHEGDRRAAEISG
jgi:hypothetical protein